MIYNSRINPDSCAISKLNALIERSTTSISPCKYKYGKYEKGFTLIELMVVVLVSAVILVFAVPSFIGIINNNRITAAANDLSTSFAIARTEAIKASSIAQVKPLNGTDWAQGYDIRVENNIDNSTFDETERVRIFEPIDESIFINSTTTVVFFNSLGGLGKTFLGVSGSETFTLDMEDAPNDKAFGRKLTLTSSGATTICVESSVHTNACP